MLLNVMSFFVSLFFLVMVSIGAKAEGMLPETTLVLLSEVDGGGSMLLKNTEEQSLLLYSSVENLPGDANKDALVMLTPPVARVEAGEWQQVRFILQNKKPLQVQCLKRVIFEGIPKKLEGGSLKVGIAIRQVLPLVIHPKGLPVNREPWKLLKWSLSEGQLTLANDSPYVVRMAQVVNLQPQGTVVQLGRSYVLPGQTLSFPVTDSKVEAVRLYPATMYGFSVDSYDAPLTAKAG
ncbi:fimbrial chaperone protein [Chromobacterium haemolyticum]|uniref:fimbria/pilus chaperone family protein n=1 Tax=Chromobacterium haemolyticum TaxID=394935 RepID=UPI0009F0232F|nr:fimbria/pilus chaperone family protein [Chromobacterium haemolyticum]OQS33963.1 fimbrial chaperone protein [Chromobacterium haemolyticum]